MSNLSADPIKTQNDIQYNRHSEKENSQITQRKENPIYKKVFIHPISSCGEIWEILYNVEADDHIRVREFHFVSFRSSSPLNEASQNHKGRFSFSFPSSLSLRVKKKPSWKSQAFWYFYHFFVSHKKIELLVTLQLSKTKQNKMIINK